MFMRTRRRVGFSSAIFFGATVALFGATIAASTEAQPARADVIGLWQTKDRDGIVELYPCSDKICGRLHWLEAPQDESGRPSLDDRNPDPALRARPLCGMTFMGDFSPETETRYSGGWIYSPRSGSTYQARLTLSDHDTLLLHGYVFTPFLGETQVWTRAESSKGCPPS